MAGVTKVHPIADVSATQHFNGLTVTVVDIDFTQDFDLLTVANQDAAINAIGENATPIIYSKVTGAGNADMTVIFEGDFSGSDFGASENQTFAAAMATALNATAGLSGATVTASTTF